MTQKEIYNIVLDELAGAMMSDNARIIYAKRISEKIWMNMQI